MEALARKAYKAQKKQYKKGWKKATRAPRLLAGLFGFLTVVLVLMLVLVTFFDQTFYVMTESPYYKLEQGAKSASIDSEYFKSDFSSDEERRAYGALLCQKLEEEGAVLLKNENGALPLAEGSGVSCFSTGSVDPVYGGTGSGAVDTATAVTWKGALEQAGLKVNGSLWDFYVKGAGASYRRSVAQMGYGTYAINEVPWEVYDESALGELAAYGDAAIVMFGRVGGEGADLPVDTCSDGLEGNYLTLNAQERALLVRLNALKEEGTVKKIIVLLNTANALEMDFVNDPAYGVDACLWIGDVGQSGLLGVANLLSGKVSPSGHLADTFCLDNLTSPAAQNMGARTYTNADSVPLSAPKSNTTHYVLYAEGIYVGYKYYETRYEDRVMGTGNAGDYDYSRDVAYPFGFGLSYTDFAYSGYEVKYNPGTDCFDISLTVTNTGDTYATKETVQIYAQSPYTDYDREMGIEKAAVTLVGFMKTGTLAPGEQETVHLFVERRELASYDAYGEKTYILEAGDYYLTAGKNAHDAVNNILSAKGYTPENTQGVMDDAGRAELVFTYNNPALDAKTYALSPHGAVITNQFDNADLNLYDGERQKVVYLSRSDWTGTFPKAVELEITETMAADLALRRYEGKGSAQMPLMGAEQTLKLIELKGAAFDDPRWEQLLNQMTFEEMAYLVGHAFHVTMPIASIDLPGTHDENGPQGLTGMLLLSALDSASFTSEDVMAATWNRDLIAEVGRVIGEDCLANGYAGLYGPGANNHRTPYSGRNFEYFSEDGFLAGKLCEAEVTAIQQKGVYVMIKHCALNDSESKRDGICTWVNEQAIREIYLKAFQYALESNDTAGIMSSYSRQGCIWNGAHEGLLKGVLRGEWGNHGMYISDNTSMYTYMDGIDGTLAGTTLYDAMAGLQYKSFMETKGQDAAVAEALREACHYNLYTMVNSSAMNGVTVYDEVVPVQAPWHTMLYVLSIVFGLAWIACILWRIRRSKQYKNTHQAPVKPRA